ncbi:hypothetical protein FJY94_06270 [Candidatus Kaiserbacteria bacterium]|nr:hypothetical protein [Candidatus Kaiserbacteria bacterium]
MNGNTALDIIMDRLARTSTDMRASALREMNLLMHTKLEKGPSPPWFLLQDKQASMVTVNGQEYVALPSGFIRFDDDNEVGGLFLYDSAITGPDKWKALTRSGYNKMQNYYYGEDSGSVPEAYDLVMERVYLRPVPDAVYQLRILAYFADVDCVDAASTNLWLTHADDVLVAETAGHMARVHLRNPELAQSIEADRQAARDRVYRAHVAFIESMKSREMGDD